MKIDLNSTALVIAGHGSTLNPDSSTPTYQHADEIRHRAIFHEVHETFWKEEPHYRDVLRQVESNIIYIVPNFISQGYFTQQILPREFDLTPPTTVQNGKTIHYCDPIGIHPSLTNLLLKRAESVLEQESIDLKQTCLIIAGHGTSLNQNSTQIIYQQVKLLKEKGLYGDCIAAFMEQDPFLHDWQKLTDLPNVIVVPFFISDALHAYEDIPVLLGITDDVKKSGFTSKTHIQDRTIWYSTSIGSEPMLTDLILSTVEDFNEKHLLTKNTLLAS